MSNDEACGGCSRRAVMQGLIAASALVPFGCRLDDPEGVAVDAPMGSGDAPDPGFAMCGSNMCVDLSNAMNAALANPGGFRIINVPGDKVILSRVDATTFSTFSAVCTHAGCSVRYVGASNSFQCPCHGSKYDATGAVTQGPALRPLKTYQNTFDMTGMMVTIML